MKTQLNWTEFRRAFLLALAAVLAIWSFTAEASAQDTKRTWQVRIQPQSRRAVKAPQIAQADKSEPMAVPTPSSVEEVALASPTSTRFDDADWTVTIVPNEVDNTSVNGRSYNDVYRSIPYRRAEYLANPSYRHDATMEIMFGQLRPTTIVRHTKPQVIDTPNFTLYKPYRASQTELYWRSNAYLGPFGWSGRVGPYYPAYPRRPLLY